MFVPEYTITASILSSISSVEYGKAVIDNTTILPVWEKQLQKDAIIKTLQNTLASLGTNLDTQTVKSIVDGMAKAESPFISNLQTALNETNIISTSNELHEEELKKFHRILTQKMLSETKQGSYRTTRQTNKTDPVEILAEIVQLFDWYNSMDARETHPIITASILKARLETIKPFENYNETVANLIVYTTLKSKGYGFKSYISLEDYYYKTKRDYEKNLNESTEIDTDFSAWTGYFCEGLSYEVSNVSEKVKLLVRDTKIAKATGRVRLSQRQERIVEYLQDYGILQNKDFTTVFPNVSEDSVLRDLKVLLDKGIVQKSGSTKSSRYELS